MRQPPTTVPSAWRRTVIPVHCYAAIRSAANALTSCSTMPSIGSHCAVHCAGNPCERAPKLPNRRYDCVAAWRRPRPERALSLCLITAMCKCFWAATKLRSGDRPGQLSAGRLHAVLSVLTEINAPGRRYTALLTASLPMFTWRIRLSVRMSGRARTGVPRMPERGVRIEPIELGVP